MIDARKTVGGPVQPTLTQLVDQVRGEIVLPAPIAHPSGQYEFDHVGVYEVVLGLPELPVLELQRITLRIIGLPPP